MYVVLKVELGIKNVFKGGHKTESGHNIGMTNDQMNDFMAKRVEAVRDINTDSAFTAERKAELIKNMPSMKDFGFYEFLNSQYQTGMSLAAEIDRLMSDNKRNKASKPRGMT